MLVHFCITPSWLLPATQRSDSDAGVNNALEMLWQMTVVDKADRLLKEMGAL